MYVPVSWSVGVFRHLRLLLVTSATTNSTSYMANDDTAASAQTFRKNPRKHN